MFLVYLGSAESMTEPRKVRIPPGIVSMPWVGKTYAISGGDWSILVNSGISIGIYVFAVTLIIAGAVYAMLLRRRLK